MSEKIKVIIYLMIFIIILIGVTIFLNSKNSQQQNKDDESNVGNEIIEVNEENFDKEVLNSNKKVLIDFYATWCGPCKILKPTMEEIAKEHGELKIVEIDVDKCQQLVNKYGIKAMPTLVLVENGKETNRLLGAAPKNNILEMCGIN